MRTPFTRAARGGKFGKLLIYAPIAIELLTLLRNNQKKKQGKYVKARRRDKAVDFMLGQAQKRFGTQKKKRGWF